MEPITEFTKWYESLEVIKPNKGPAKGSITTALVVLNRLKEKYDLNFQAHVAKKGTQIKGASGAAVAAILKSFGEERTFSREGGRTNRGGPAGVQSMLDTLRKLGLEKMSVTTRNQQIDIMMSYLVDRVRDYHNRQKIKLTFDPSHSTWHIVHNFLIEAAQEGKAGFVAQHLVGAKLELRFPEIHVSNESGSTADLPTQRPGDFLIGHTAFHVTVAPMNGVFDKCRHNILQGFKPFLLVPDDKLQGTRQLAEEISKHQIAVESIESFVSQNINELSGFNRDQLAYSFKQLVVIYNRRVDEVETDKSLMIELPSNLK
ncbi:MAG: DUF4928 family protein [Bacteroidetes bacterium]|nr:DUF4928 family protein [Bacteroidota bacterium]